jgi:hypothetical protein
MKRAPGDPDQITVCFVGTLIKTMDENRMKSFLTKKFNEMSHIFMKNEAQVNINNISATNYSAPGTVPTEKFDALEADLKPHKFEVQRKLMH